MGARASCSRFAVGGGVSWAFECVPVHIPELVRCPRPPRRFSLHPPRRSAQGAPIGCPIPFGRSFAVTAQEGYRVYISGKRQACVWIGDIPIVGPLFMGGGPIFRPTCARPEGNQLERPNIRRRPSMRLKSLSLLRIIPVWIFMVAMSARSRPWGPPRCARRTRKSCFSSKLYIAPKE